MDSKHIKINSLQFNSEVDPFTIKRYQLFLKCFSCHQKSILDFGCNTGRGGAVLRSVCSDRIIIGADIVRERLEKIPKGIYNDIIDLSKDSLLDTIDNADIIVSGEVVEHIPFKDLLEYLIIFYDIINENGLLLLTTPNPDAFLVKMGRDSVIKDPSHINIMKRQFLRTVLLKLGFKSVEIKGSGKAVKYFGENFPLFNIYGSYLIIAHK
jgi:predicted TPR repeat methyltransferase